MRTLDRGSKALSGFRGGAPRNPSQVRAVRLAQERGLSRERRAAEGGVGPGARLHQNRPPARVNLRSSSSSAPFRSPPRAVPPPPLGRSPSLRGSSLQNLVSTSSRSSSRSFAILTRRVVPRVVSTATRETVAPAPAPHRTPRVRRPPVVSGRRRARTGGGGGFRRSSARVRPPREAAVSCVCGRASLGGRASLCAVVLFFSPAPGRRLFPPEPDP